MVSAKMDTMVALVARASGSRMRGNCAYTVIDERLRYLDVAAVEAYAEDAHLHAGLGMPFPDPLLLARRNDFAVNAITSVPDCDDPCRGQVLNYRPRGNRREAGWDVYHGLAHGLLARRGVDHSHRDVTALQFALIATREVIRGMLQTATTRDVLRALVRRQVHAPTLQIRIRLQQVLAQNLSELL